jgi:hypothetical protein
MDSKTSKISLDCSPLAAPGPPFDCVSVVFHDLIFICKVNSVYPTMQPLPNYAFISAGQLIMSSAAATIAYDYALPFKIRRSFRKCFATKNERLAND